jgi:DNA-binding GntR family transcriptional regulator
MAGERNAAGSLPNQDPNSAKAEADQDWSSLAVRETLADGVYTQIREAIIRGDLPDGVELKQGQLASRFGVSRVPVREALRRLQAERLVTAKPFYRFVVGALPPDQILDLVDARAELETLALKRSLAMPDVVAARVASARTVAESMSPRDEDWLAKDRRFHLILLGEGTAFATLVEDSRDWIGRYVFSAGSSVLRRQAAGREHAAILDALSTGDAERLERAVRNHIAGTRKVLEKFLGARDRAPAGDSGSVGDHSPGSH